MKKLRTFLAVGSTMLILSVILAACSSSSNPTGSGGGGGGGNPNAISISGMSFTPTATNVKVGSTVTWTNRDPIAHTVTSNNGAFTSSGNIAPGTTYSVTFATAGSFSYHCSIHPTMKGTINVTM